MLDVTPQVFRNIPDWFSITLAAVLGLLIFMTACVVLEDIISRIKDKNERK